MTEPILECQGKKMKTSGFGKESRFIRKFPPNACLDARDPENFEKPRTIFQNAELSG
jgi:hypothetical protein